MIWTWKGVWSATERKGLVLPPWGCSGGQLVPQAAQGDLLQQLRPALEQSSHACQRSVLSGSLSLLPTHSWGQASCVLAYAGPGP